MNNSPHHLLLADDDLDDCAFFKDALADLSIKAFLTIVNDGDTLMHTLQSQLLNLPDLLFLDLNMPRKNGLECLEKIKSDEKLLHLPVIIYSTSLNQEVVDQVYQQGAHYYIRKPGNYAGLKKVIRFALNIASQKTYQPSRENFILHA